MPAVSASLPRSRLARGWHLLRAGELGVSRERCSGCGFRMQIRLRRDEIGVRCVRCGASAVSQSLIAVIRALVDELQCRDVYELSTSGPVLAFLRRNARSVVCSELLDDVPVGTVRGGVLCQDVQRLTFGDSSFDLCTSAEVFEHVADDRAGFREMHRVLRPGGLSIFTVPIAVAGVSIERTSMIDGRRVNTMPIELHHDRYRSEGVFCYRNYGRDILDRLRAAGFAHAEFVEPAAHLFGFARPVVVARKA